METIIIIIKSNKTPPLPTSSNYPHFQTSTHELLDLFLIPVMQAYFTNGLDRSGNT